MPLRHPRDRCGDGRGPMLPSRPGIEKDSVPGNWTGTHPSEVWRQRERAEMERSRSFKV